MRMAFERGMTPRINVAWTFTGGCWPELSSSRSCEIRLWTQPAAQVLSCDERGRK